MTKEGIPVSAIITGANVHDSQCAIPLERMTEQRINFRYCIMDSAYDAKNIFQFVCGRGRIPIIDHNKRRKDLRDTFDEATKEHYKKRSVVERANSHLKDWLLPDKVLVRGNRKVGFELMCGVICLAAIKILAQFILPNLI
ncbi:MAG: Transposase DDE domain protein [Parcubacteria group bacterium ADurb.Bin216]|nr:MAG: Transposase DDE domain protein [Parcubacteria group bacterium ADurb.Bin216]